MSLKVENTGQNSASAAVFEHCQNNLDASNTESTLVKGVFDNLFYPDNEKREARLRLIVSQVNSVAQNIETTEKSLKEEIAEIKKSFPEQIIDISVLSEVLEKPIQKIKEEIPNYEGDLGTNIVEALLGIGTLAILDAILGAQKRSSLQDMTKKFLDARFSLKKTEILLCEFEKKVLALKSNIKFLQRMSKVNHEGGLLAKEMILSNIKEIESIEVQNGTVIDVLSRLDQGQWKDEDIEKNWKPKIA